MAAINPEGEVGESIKEEADDNMENPKAVEAVISEFDFHEVTDQLGPDDLQHLFYNLGIPQRDIKHAEKSADTHDTRLKARAVLREWKQRKGRDATLKALLEAKEKTCTASSSGSYGMCAPHIHSIPQRPLQHFQNIQGTQRTQQNLHQGPQPFMQQSPLGTQQIIQDPLQNPQQNIPGNIHHCSSGPQQPLVQQGSFCPQQILQESSCSQQQIPLGLKLIQQGVSPHYTQQGSALAGLNRQLMPPMILAYPYTRQYMIQQPFVGQPYGQQMVATGIPNVPFDIPFDVDICQKRLQDIYKTKRKGINFLPGMPKNFDIEEFFVELKLLSEESRPAKVRRQELDKYTDLLTLRNGQGREQKHILVRGVAGTGKTTLVSRLAYQWANQAPEELMEDVSDCKLRGFKLLFAIDIRKIKPKMDLVDVLIDQLLPEVSKRSLQRFLADNSDLCIFLCDGYDELSPRIVNIFNIPYLCGALVIVTTRPNKVDEFTTHNEGYVHVSLEGFSKASVCKFILQFFISSMEDDINEAQNRYKSMILSLRTSPVMCSLAHYPLLLGMMCLLWQHNERLPETVTSLYEQAVEYLGRHWMVKCQTAQSHQSSWQDYSHFKESVDMEKVLVKLGETAFIGLKQNHLIFSETAFDSSDLIDQTCSFGLVYKESVVKGFDKVNHVQFIHFTFQEFCAAKYLVKMAESNDQTFLDFLNTIRLGNLEAFEIVLKFCCGMSSKTAVGIVTHVVKTMSNFAKEVMSSRLSSWYRRHASISLSLWSLPFRLVFESDMQSSVINAFLHSLLHPLTATFDIYRFLCTRFSNPEIELIINHYATKFNGHSRNQTWLANVRKATIPIESYMIPDWPVFLRVSKQLLELLPNLTKLSISVNHDKLDYSAREALYPLSKSVFDDVHERDKIQRERNIGENRPSESLPIPCNLSNLEHNRHVCSTYLRINNQIKYLNIELLCFEMDSLVAFVIKQKQLEGLRLVGNCISDTDMVKLLTVLKSKSPLSFELSQNPVGHHLSICQVMLCHLHELSLPYAGMDTAGCAQLFEGFTAQGKQICLQNPKAKLPLQKLDMSWNRIGDAVDKLAEALPYMSDLNHLDLSVTNLESRHMLKLSSGLKCVRNLGHIALVGCHFGDAMNTFMEDLQQMKKLTLLRVCGIKEHACEHIDVSLNHVGYLLSVNSFCACGNGTVSWKSLPVCGESCEGIVIPTQIGPESTKTLCDSLHNFPILTCLDLSKNAMKSQGVFALCDELHHIPLVENLLLQDNLIGEDGIMKLSQSFHLIPKLQELVLGEGNENIHATCADVFIRNLVHLQELRSLNMPGADVTNDECKSMPLLETVLEIRSTSQFWPMKDISSKHSLLDQKAIKSILSQVEHYLMYGMVKPISELL